MFLALFLWFHTLKCGSQKSDIRILAKTQNKFSNEFGVFSKKNLSTALAKLSILRVFEWFPSLNYGSEKSDVRLLA